MSVPVVLGRDEARRLARVEFTDRDYHHDDPGLVERGLGWALDRLSELADRFSGATGGHPWLALLLLALLVGAVVVAVRVRVGPVARRTAADAVLFEDGAVDAAEYRRRADAYAVQGAWDLAARERFRAIVRDLEQRGLLDLRPGRTVAEAAREAGAVLPPAAEALRRAAGAFDDVWYGGRTADQGTDALLRQADLAVR